MFSANVLISVFLEEFFLFSEPRSQTTIRIVLYMYGKGVAAPLLRTSSRELVPVPVEIELMNCTRALSPAVPGGTRGRAVLSPESTGHRPGTAGVR